MESSLCRVCLENGGDMVNIFEEPHAIGISIAIMISESTGFKVERGELGSPMICPSCLKDARNASEIKHIYERSTLLYCQLKMSRAPPKDNLSKSEGGARLTVSPVKEEVAEDMHAVGEPCISQCQVKNEPLEEDVFEEEQVPILECGIKMEVAKESLQVVGIGNSKANSNREYKCRYCPRTFASKAVVKRHLRVHSVNRKRQCPHCLKYFVGVPSLNTHLLLHTDRPVFKCSQCPRSYFKKARLQLHRVRIKEALYLTFKTFVMNNLILWLGNSIRNSEKFIQLQS